MLDFYDVSGCYILRPWAYRIWQEIQSKQMLCHIMTCLDSGTLLHPTKMTPNPCIYSGIEYIDHEIEELGVENSYFPMFIPAKNLEREKEHIEGFAAEVAWVTKA